MHSSLHSYLCLIIGDAGSANSCRQQHHKHINQSGWLIKSLSTSLPGELRLAPHAPSSGWHTIHVLSVCLIRFQHSPRFQHGIFCLCRQLQEARLASNSAATSSAPSSPQKPSAAMRQAEEAAQKAEAEAASLGAQVNSLTGISLRCRAAVLQCCSSGTCKRQVMVNCSTSHLWVLHKHKGTGYRKPVHAAVHLSICAHAVKSPKPICEELLAAAANAIGPCNGLPLYCKPAQVSLATFWAA